MTKTYAGQMFFRECGDKVWFVGVIDKPDELMTDEELRPFVIIPGYHQTAMMLIDPGDQTDEFKGYGVDGVVTEGEWKTGITEFDKLPHHIRSLAYSFVTKPFRGL